MVDQERFFQEGIFDVWVDSKRESDVKELRQKLLTKSKYLNAIQCPKYLWIRCNEPQRIPDPSESLQYVFNIGKEVGQLAKQRFPGGADIPEDGFIENIEKTKELLGRKERCPIYEAGIMADRFYARADILVPVEGDSWDIVEVKCSTSVKEINYDDVAFQSYVYKKAGLKINRCCLMHINNQYVRQGDIDIGELFTIEDITDEVSEAENQVESVVEGLLKIIDREECPSCGISEMCSNPYDCPLIPECWAHIPDGSVFEFNRMKKKKRFELYDGGKVLMKDAADKDLNPKQMIQKRCSQEGDSYVDESLISGFLNGLKYPLCYLDFETVMSPVPRFDGVRPYQQIPFQFSVHVQEYPGADLKHKMFLVKSSNDPRSEIIENLKEALGEDGSIAVYYATFEKTRLKELGRDFPETQEWVDSVLSRIVDLHDPFAKFWFYHPSQKGKTSIKKVLPVVTGKSYEGMEIADGATAFREYARVTYSEVSEEERQRVYDALEKYCALDTEGMVELVKSLEKLSKTKQ